MTQDELKQLELRCSSSSMRHQQIFTAEEVDKLLSHITAQATKIEELEALNKNQSSTIADLMVTKDHAAICRHSGQRGTLESLYGSDPNFTGGVDIGDFLKSQNTSLESENAELKEKIEELEFKNKTLNADYISYYEIKEQIPVVLSTTIEALESENARLRDALERHRAYIIRISQLGQSKRGSTSVGRLRKSARKFLVGNEAKSGAYCLDCMLPYEFFPVDLIVEDSLWDEITPETEGGQGLLCPMCITKRVANICDGMTLKILAQSAIKGETE